MLRVRAWVTLCVLASAVLTLGTAAATATAPADSASTVWLCRPGLRPGLCAPGLSTTRFALTPAEHRLGVVHPRAGRRGIDCFYVYPTVSDQKTTNANLRVDAEERSITLYQASRFSSVCRVFAPMYRQLTVSAIADPNHVSGPGAALAYQSLLSAWHTYLARYNHGRGIVLIGHSQGAYLLRALIGAEIDNRPSIRRRLVSAILLGGNVTVRRGRGIGGDFQHVPACRSQSQLGCVIAYSTYESAPPPDSLFGRTSAPGLQVLCTDPATLSGSRGRLDAVLPSQPFAPGSSVATGIRLLGVRLPTALTTWVEIRGAYRARCSAAAGADVLRITPVGRAPAFAPSPDATWGLHLIDFNIALGNLVDIVRHQAQAYARR